ncbi:MAG: protein kinase [candidate division Zixibacteria bacterium]|nr:protein kinase [candidate division Zixibacteria bacterium]
MVEALEQKRQVKIGDYLITGKIGQGGIAEIYKGRQESLNRDVAIKILSSQLTSEPDIVKRFERESMVIARLSHPNIVHVIDKGVAGGRYYFVMDYVDGTSLRQVIDSPQIPLKTKLDMIVQVCKALDYAHKNGVIHRDIKPPNVLIDREGNALVADFGIAQMVSTPESEMTSSDVIMGTLAYMSPEQKQSSTNVDQTTDIYAVGVMLYEILLNKKPLGHFKLPSEVDKTISTKFDNIILKCLAQEAKDRYQTAVELKDAILEALGEDQNGAAKSDFSVSGTDSFQGKCRYLDTIKETRFSSTVLVENRVTKKLFVIKKHQHGEAGRKEASILKSLKHENIINIHGSGGDRKTTVIISEYAPGGSLADRMVRRYDWEKAMGIILAVASGLAFAHKNNIVHGNLRPSNILFDAEEAVKICDFGLTGHYDAAGKKNWYAAPERKRSKQGDIYALGVILHQMLTNRNPSYDSGSSLIIDGSMKATVSEDICRMLSKLLAIRAGLRYKSFDEFLADWDDFDQRRRAAAARKIEPEALPETDRAAMPLWAYAVVALLIIVGVLAGMYFGGLFN